MVITSFCLLESNYIICTLWDFTNDYLSFPCNHNYMFPGCWVGAKRPHLLIHSLLFPGEYLSFSGGVISPVHSLTVCGVYFQGDTNLFSFNNLSSDWLPVPYLVSWWHCLLQDDWLHTPLRWYYSFPFDHLSFLWLPVLCMVMLPAPRWPSTHPFEVTLFISLWLPVLSLTAHPLLGNTACSKMPDYTSLQGDAIYFPLVSVLCLETFIYLRLFVVSKENEGYHGCSMSINSW